MRFNVHIVMTAPPWDDVTAVVTMPADTDGEAQDSVCEMLPDLAFDVVEIECASCSMPVEDCQCTEGMHE